MSKKQKLYVKKILTNLFFAIPYYDSEQIIKNVAKPHLKQLPSSIAVWLCVISYIRHEYTDYDNMLQNGFEKDAARHYTTQQINDILEKWQCTKKLSE